MAGVFLRQPRDVVGAIVWSARMGPWRHGGACGCFRHAGTVGKGSDVVSGRFAKAAFVNAKLAAVDADDTRVAHVREEWHLAML